MKTNRQNKILELVAQRNIETQEELAELLNEAGYQVTQATISRDIRELKLTKVPVAGGRQKYIVLGRSVSQAESQEKFARILKEALVSMDTAQNLLVIRTSAGMAMAVAAAIDALHMETIVGSLAGDDTVFCALKTAEDAMNALRAINARCEALDKTR